MARGSLAIRRVALLVGGALFLGAVLLLHRLSLAPAQHAEQSDARPVHEPEDLASRRSVQPRSTDGGNETGDTLGDKIQRLESSLAAMEADIYSRDPLLRAYEQYREKPFEWFSKDKRREFSAFKGWLGVSDPAEARKRQGAYEELSNLYGLIELKELNDDPQFSRLIGAAQEILISSKGFPPFPYWHLDGAIGFPEAGTGGATPAAATSWENLLAQLTQRYPYATAAVAAIQQKWGVADDVLAGIQCDCEYRIVTTAVDLYVTDHMAPLRDLRDQLRYLQNQLPQDP